MDQEQDDGVGREHEYREQLAHVEDTLAAIRAQEQAAEHRLQEIKQEKRPFEEEQKRLQGLIQQELAQRYGHEERQETGSTQEFRNAAADERPQPVFKSEIDKLEEQISRPNVEPTLAPPGMPRPVQGERDQAIAKRVAVMKQQLGQQNDKARDAFTKAVQHDHTR